MKILNTWRAGFFNLVSGRNNRADDQVSANSITVVLKQYHVKTSWQVKFLEILTEYTSNSRRATGNIMAEAYYEKGDACTMWTMERWSDHPSYKNNRRSGAAKSLEILTKTGLASPVETIFIKDLELLSKEMSGNNSKTNDPPLTIMLFVNVKTGTENYFRSINHDLMLALRNEPGVLAFQFSQLSDHASKFIVCKKFRNWDTFQYHLKDPALEPVMKFLQTSIYEPPFEKGYTQLIQFAPQ